MPLHSRVEVPKRLLVVVDLAPDLLIPQVPAPQFALIEEDLNAGGAKCLANLLCSLRILRGVAQKYRVRWLSHLRTTVHRSREVFSPPP